MDLGADGAQAIISVGGAATRCQHQSPCFDMTCNLCYDPLLRIHGTCGGEGDVVVLQQGSDRGD